jgi:hypothetical protein
MWVRQFDRTVQATTNEICMGYSTHKSVSNLPYSTHKSVSNLPYTTYTTTTGRIVSRARFRQCRYVAQYAQKWDDIPSIPWTNNTTLHLSTCSTPIHSTALITG